VVGAVCCLAERRRLRCRRGVSHGLGAAVGGGGGGAWRPVDDRQHCQRLPDDDAKVRRTLQIGCRPQLLL